MKSKCVTGEPDMHLLVPDHAAIDILLDPPIVSLSWIGGSRKTMRANVTKDTFGNHSPDTPFPGTASWVLTLRPRGPGNVVCQVSVRTKVFLGSRVFQSLTTISS